MSKAERKTPPRGYGQSMVTQGVQTAKQKKRDRSWDQLHRPCTYKIPQRLHKDAEKLRDSILSIAQFDEQGQSRNDSTTVDDVASTLIDYALETAESGGVEFHPTPQGRMTLHWEHQEDENKNSVLALKPPLRLSQRKEAPFKKLVFSYRWQEEYDQRIKALAGKGSSSSVQKHNPHKYVVPVGEVVVRLLQQGVDAYCHGIISLVSSPVDARQTVNGWQERS